MNASVPIVPGQPILGNLREFRTDRIGLLQRIPERYGDIARIDIGFLFRAFVVSAPEFVRETLIEKSDAFEKGHGLSLFAEPFLGKGLLASEHEFHRRQRRMMAPAFVHARISEYANTIGAYANQCVERLDRQRVLDLSEEMMQLTFEIVGKTLFDADVSSDARDVGEALTVAMQNLTDQISSAVPIPPSIPSPGNLRAKRGVRRMDEVVYRLIRERRASKKDAGDFLSMLLAAQDEDDASGMTDKQVRDEAMTILLAGHETTANALAWTFYLLARNPSVRDQLECEVDRVLGGRVPALEDLPRLPYALQVLKEAMRLYPPAYMLVRRAIREVEIGPARVKRNQGVIVNISGMHRRAKYFSDPERFDPDRFSPEREKALEKHAYLPFGGGPRICIGNHFALMEGQIVLAHLAQHFRFELTSANAVAPEPLITLRPKGGVHVRVERRRPAGANAVSGAITARA